MLETTQGGLTANGKYPHDMTFLCHLPPGASYHTVEIDLKTSKPSVPDGILRLPEYQKRLKERRVKRQSKRAEEDKYSEMVAKEFDRKDEHYKNQAGVYISSKCQAQKTYLFLYSFTKAILCLRLPPGPRPSME